MGTRILKIDSEMTEIIESKVGNPSRIKNIISKYYQPQNSIVILKFKFLGYYCSDCKNFGAYHVENLL